MKTNTKAITSGIITLFLLFISLLQILISQNFIARALSVITAAVTLIFGIFLVRSVLLEVEEREELRELNKKLDAANRQLEELNRFKSQLLSLASHQIKSPLAAIKGFVSLIVSGSYGPVEEKIKEPLEKVRASADELISLINTILDLRKVEEGKMEYHFRKIDLNKLVLGVVDMLRPLADNKKLEFVFSASGKEVLVNADTEKLKHVVQNLIDNAIKYTPSGYVHIELKEEAGAAIVSVSDSGLGIPTDLIPYLFEEFIRDERVKKEILGTGFGLYIARKITEAHGGKILAESPGEGKGSAFHVSIPEMK